jgi:Xaa-Pro aminopeptidase
VQTIRRNRWRRVGFETRRIDYASYQLLKEHLPVACALEPLGDTIEQQRMVKSLSEIELIRASVQTNSKAFQLAVRNLKPGMREYELAAELDYQMRRLGAERPAFDTIVASGHRTALPHAQPTEARLENDQLVLVDMGATQAGYASDMTRMLHLGRPAARVRRLYAAVLEAQMAALAEVCEGATAGGVDRKARQTMRAHGLEKAFLHSTGHGVGLEIHEPPRLGKKDKTRLRSGMVVTIEPGAYLEGFGGVRIEDTVLVTEYGCEVLTPTAKDLLLI